MEKHLTYLNPETVEEVTDMMDGDTESLVDLIDTLMETTPELMHELSTGVDQRDAVAIREAAHALKSSSAQMGAQRFSDICKEMEEKGKNGDVDSAISLFPSLQQEQGLMLGAMNEWKNAIQ